MRLKRRPEEFIVEEVADIKPLPSGRYSLYRVKKFKANTMDVIRDLSRRLKVPLGSLSYGGLKDRYSVSTQYVTVDRDVRFDVKARNYEAIYLGKVDEPMGKSKVLGNRFDITLRGFPPEGKDSVLKACGEAKRFGFVNYYGDQRFGSARHGKGFFAKRLIERDYEGALRLLFTPSKKDGSKARRFKRCVMENWGSWRECLELAEYPYERRILSFLSGRRLSSTNIKKALELIDHEILLLFLHAYQSYIWNETVGRLISKLCKDTFEVSYSMGVMVFYRVLEDKELSSLLGLEVPFPGPKLEPEAPWGDYMLSVLKSEGIEGLEHFKTHIKGGLFETHRRRVLVFPEDLEVDLFQDDRPDSLAVRLRFILPSGSYATTLMKRVFGSTPGVSFEA